MPRPSDVSKLQVQKAALLDSIASRQEKIKALERSIAAREKAHQRQWERETGHLAWLAGLQTYDKDTLLAMFMALGKHQEDPTEKPRKEG